MPEVICKAPDFCTVTSVVCLSDPSLKPSVENITKIINKKITTNSYVETISAIKMVMRKGTQGTPESSNSLPLHWLLILHSIDCYAQITISNLQPSWTFCNFINNPCLLLLFTKEEKEKKSKKGKYYIIEYIVLPLLE